MNIRSSNEIAFQLNDIAKEELIEILTWMHQNIVYHYNLRVSNSYSSDKYNGQIIFYVEKEAATFKLRWCY